MGRQTVIHAFKSECSNSRFINRWVTVPILYRRLRYKTARDNTCPVFLLTHLESDHKKTTADEATANIVHQKLKPYANKCKRLIMLAFKQCSLKRQYAALNTSKHYIVKKLAADRSYLVRGSIPHNVVYGPVDMGILKTLKNDNSPHVYCHATNRIAEIEEIRDW